MGFFDSIGDLFGDAFGGAADAVEGVGSSLADGADVIGDAINPYVNPTTIASLIAMAYGMPTGFDGMNMGGELMSGMDLAADGGFGNAFGLTSGIGEGSALDTLGSNVADNAASGFGGSSYANSAGMDPSSAGISNVSTPATMGDWGPSSAGLDKIEPWQTTGNGMPPTSGLASPSLPSWLQSPGAFAQKAGTSALTQGVGGYLGQALGGSKLGDLSNIIAGINSRNTQGQVGQQTREQLDAMRAQITGMYAPGSPELAQMQAQMDRADAKAGRRSQYGQRATELAGNIAKYKSDALQRLDQGTLGQYVTSLNTTANRNSGLYGALGKVFGNTTLNGAISGLGSLGGQTGMSGWQNGLTTGSNGSDQLYG